MLFKILPSIRNIGNLMNIGTPQEPTIRNKKHTFAEREIVRNAETDSIGVIDKLLDDGSVYILSYNLEWLSGCSDIWNVNDIVPVHAEVAYRWELNIPPHTLLHKLAFGEVA